MMEEEGGRVKGRMVTKEEMGGEKEGSVSRHTDANGESEDGEACKYVFHQVRLTGTDESCCLAVMFVVVGGAGDERHCFVIFKVVERVGGLDGLEEEKEFEQC